MKSPPTTGDGDDVARDNDFLLREGLDFLVAYKAIKNESVRKAMLTIVAAVAQAELEARDG